MKPGNVRNMLTGACEIADGVVSILTFGFYYPHIAFKFSCWAELRYCKKQLTREKRVDN